MANEKHIFIGIGGQGVKTVAQIKAKVYEKRFQKATATKTRLQAMNDSYRFIFIDTDQRDIDNANKDNRETFEHGKVPFINPQTDLINLGKANPSAIYYEAKKDPTNLINKRILEACSPELSNKIPDQPLSFGAGAFRIKSRIAFAHSLAEFQSKLQAAISSLNDVKTVGGGDCTIHYWLVSSSLGGTGSGIFNDVLYHINQLHRQIVGDGNPKLVYTMYMPKVFIDANSTEEKYSLNAFGVFSELEAFKKMNYEENQKTVMHRLAFNDDYNLVDYDNGYRPFSYMIPIDIQTDKGTSLGSINTMCHNTAEMLYHLHTGQAGKTFLADVDNYMDDIMEHNHEDFLVPMGYVSLQKPQEQFSKYMKARFRRDVLRSWLLCNSRKQSKVSEDEAEELKCRLFKELNSNADNTIASRICKNDDINEILNSTGTGDDENIMSDAVRWDNVCSKLDELDERIKEESKDSKIDEYVKIISDSLWLETEKLIIEKGLAYTLQALEEVRKKIDKDNRDSNPDSELENLKSDNAAKLSKENNDAADNPITEKIAGKVVGSKSNSRQIETYVNDLHQYIDDYKRFEIEKWSKNIMERFCGEKDGEIAKLIKYLQNTLRSAEDKEREAVEFYRNKLSAQVGETALDVTSVYLPMLKGVCDGNGWIPGNVFSKLYTKIVPADDSPEEVPDRDDITNLLYTNIYSNPTDSVKDYIKGKYEIFPDKMEDEEENVSGDVVFFANKKILDRGTISNDKIIEDFLTVAEIIFEDKMSKGEIKDLWYDRKISEFFSDLKNAEKDEIRQALNPALFFSYNTNRIDVTKKEERLIFIAGSEDLAEEMLGYQKGNTKHRFEKGGDNNTALVLKSKYGLSLKDYRIYDSIKMVYDKATFREKYHFHHDFAQYLDKLTLDNLPYEIMPQHRSFVKMLILEKYKEDLAPLFYQDEYDKEAYKDTMYFKDSNVSFKIALPEAFITDLDFTQGKLAFRYEADGRLLYREIEGENFVERFEKYKELYHNERYGETADRLIQAILRTNIHNDKETSIHGERILKDHYAEKRESLLRDLNEKKLSANTPEEKRIYGMFFNILREEYKTVNEFTK